MSRRPVVLALLGHYLPGFRAGGPVRSMAGLVDRLGDELAFHILAADRDLGDHAPYPSVEPGRWLPVGRALVHYTPPAQLGFAGLARIIAATPHDLLYLNSFFAPRLTIQPLLARRLGRIARRPLLLAPRGEFSPGALAIKAARKRAYLALAGATGLHADAVWHASSATEADLIRAAVGAPADRIRIAGNLAARLGPAPPPHPPRPAGAPLRIVFLSRIAPMKNLDYALGVLARLSLPVVLTIRGPAEDKSYEALCREIAAGLPAHVRVDWRGPLEPAEVPAELARHDLLFLPSRGENFGHVIAESLGAGTPVLLADTTPWRGLAAAGVGHDLPLARPEAFVAAIEAAAAEEPAQALARRERAFRFAGARQRDDGDIVANRHLFISTLERKS